MNKEHDWTLINYFIFFNISKLNFFSIKIWDSNIVIFYIFQLEYFDSIQITLQLYFDSIEVSFTHLNDIRIT